MANRYATDPVSRLVAWWRGPWSKAAECAWIFVLSGAFAFGLRAWVAEARYIPSQSMLPGWKVGDRLIVEKLSIKLANPRRGDVVVFAPPGRARDLKNALIKRVVGLPGEHLVIREGRVWIDGRGLREPYVAEPIAYAEPDWASLGMPGGRVPRGHVFVMGDNRNNSQDSHVFGPVPIDHVIGHPVIRFWPPARLGFVRW